MRHFLRKHYILRQNWVMILGIFFTLYFAYHLVQGERSYTRMIGLERQIAQVTAEIAELQGKSEYLEKKVVMMRPGTLNRDLLEERVIDVLGYRHPNDRDVIAGAAAKTGSAAAQ